MYGAFFLKSLNPAFTNQHGGGVCMGHARGLEYCFLLVLIFKHCYLRYGSRWVQYPSLPAGRYLAQKEKKMVKPQFFWFSPNKSGRCLNFSTTHMYTIAINVPSRLQMGKVYLIYYPVHLVGTTT